jgi:uncharacterized protein YecT (DUF1311 family)
MAAAQEADGETSTIMEKCLTTAAKSDDTILAHRACIGRVASACMEAPDGQSNLGMAQCAHREGDWWDKLLNSRYGALKKAMEPAEFAALRDAQRKWVAFKEADCDYVYTHQFGNGSMRIPASAWCVLDQTALRATKLGNLLDQYNR